MSPQHEKRDAATNLNNWEKSDKFSVGLTSSLMAAVNLAALAASLLGLMLNAILVVTYGLGAKMVLLNVCTNVSSVATELKHVICSLFDQKEKKRISRKTREEAQQKLMRLAKINDGHWSTVPVDQETNMSKLLEESKKSIVELRTVVDDCIQEKKKHQYSEEETVISPAFVIDVFCTAASIAALSASNIFAGAAYDAKKANIIAVANAATVCTKILRLAVSYLEEREKASDQKRAWEIARPQLERLEKMRGGVDELSVDAGVAMKLLEGRQDMAAAAADMIEKKTRELLMQVREHVAHDETDEINFEAHGPCTGLDINFSGNCHEPITEPETKV